MSEFESHEKLLDLARDLANQIQRQLIKQGIPSLVIALATRTVARIGEAGIQSGPADVQAIYRDAVASMTFRVDQKLEACGMQPPTMLDGGPLALDRLTGEGDPTRLTPKQLSEQAADLCAQLARVMIAAGYSQEVGLLAASAMIHLSEAVLKQDDGDGSSAKRYAAYQLALPLVLASVTRGLESEGVPTKGGS